MLVDVGVLAGVDVDVGVLAGVDVDVDALAGVDVDVDALAGVDVGVDVLAGVDVDGLVGFDVDVDVAVAVAGVVVLEEVVVSADVFDAEDEADVEGALATVTVAGFCEETGFGTDFDVGEGGLELTF